MKKMLFLFLMLIGFSNAYSQEEDVNKKSESDQYKIEVSGATFIYKNEKLSSTAVGYLLKNHGDEAIYQKFSAGRRLEKISRFVGTTGVIVLFTGLGTLTASLISGNPSAIFISTGILGSGVVMALISIQIGKSGYKKQINAIDSYNNSLKLSSIEQKINLNFGLTQNGVGLTVCF
jgi:hypothetical protein